MYRFMSIPMRVRVCMCRCSPVELADGGVVGSEHGRRLQLQCSFKIDQRVAILRICEQKHATVEAHGRRFVGRSEQRLQPLEGGSCGDEVAELQMESTE